MSDGRPDVNESLFCTVKTMCGRSLAQGIYIIGWSSVVISGAMLMFCLLYLYINCDRNTLDPIIGVMTISSMTLVCMSAYQIIISILMLWQRMQKQPKSFFYSIWYVSHLSIITLYAMIACAIVVVHLKYGGVVMGLLYFIYSCGYLSTLIYFEIVMNSYLNSGQAGERFL